jgi:hypothetical protein
MEKEKNKGEVEAHALVHDVRARSGESDGSTAHDVTGHRDEKQTPSSDHSGTSDEAREPRH